MSNIILYHYWRSSSSWRVRWALNLKELPYEPRTVNLLQHEQSTTAFLEKSPMGYVPCLVIDDRVLTESVAILEFLEEKFPRVPLFPQDVWQRARVRQLVELINAGVQPLHNLNVMRRVSEEPTTQKAWVQYWVTRGLTAVERELEHIAHEFNLNSPVHALGPQITAADLYITPLAYVARRFEVDLTPFPRLTTVEQNALQTVAANAAHPDRFRPE